MIPKHILARAWLRAGAIASNLKELETRAENLRDDLVDYEGKDIDYDTGQQIYDARAYIRKARECLDTVEFRLNQQVEERDA